MNIKIKTAVDKLNKEFGAGSVISFSKSSIQKIERIGSGSLGLDIALGGGWPIGRIIEIYGPESSGKTTLALHAIAEAQKKGKVAAFIDAEHAFDPIYAENLGVQVNDEEKFIFSQPMSGDEAVEIVRELVKTGEVGIIVVDSVAAMIPKAELAGDVGDSKMGLHARLMSQAMRMLTGDISKTKCTVIFINQLRDKIGVMFGCLHYDTKINFVDGRSIPIGEVVRKKIQGEVWSFNEISGTFEPKPIIGWHINGKIDEDNDYIHIETNSINGRGRFGLTVTKNHEVLTNRGWIKAQDLIYDDKLVSKFTSKINNSLKDFLAGSFVGDSYLYERGYVGGMKLQDSINPNYLEWKINKLSKFINFTFNVDKYESESSYEFRYFKRLIRRRNPMFLFENYSDLGLAIWFMDDGSFDDRGGTGRYRSNISIKRFKDDKDILESVKLNFLKLGIECKYDSSGCFSFNKENSDEIFKRICKYVPESMQYKLPNKFKGKYEEFELISINKEMYELVDIKLIRPASARQLKCPMKYDISVKDNHNYSVGGIRNGVIVHNSPEVTTGGNALKFYASVRCDVRRIGQEKDGDEIISNLTRVKVVKNKTAPPFKKCEFSIVFGHGIDNTGEVLDLAAEYEIIKKGGAGWYSYGETKLGQGRDKVIQLLQDNPELFEEVIKKLYESLNW